MIRSVAILLLGVTAVYSQYYPGYAPPPPAYKVAPQYYAAPKVYPAAPVIAKVGSPDASAATVQEYRDASYDGSFNYGFDSSNGISAKSQGYVKPSSTPQEGPVAQVIQGSYSYTDPLTGKSSVISYIADEGGYRAFGDGLPAAADVNPAGAAPAAPAPAVKYA